MLSFDELCGKPLAAADYVALAGHFHSVAISGVPCVTAANRPAAYRFMILIDVLYEQRWVS
jgi:predicted ATPase